MDDILAAAENLAALIRNSDEVANFLAARKQLALDPALTAQVDAFQEAHQGLSAGLLHTGRPGIEEERAISGQYADLMLHPDAREYLRAERSLLDLMGRVLDTVARSVEGIVEV